MSVAIIGGNSAGSFAAYKLAKSHDVSVYEKDTHFKKVCSGILTASLFDIVPVKKEVIINSFSDVIIHAPNKKKIELHFKKKDIVVDKEAFNQSLSEMAIDAGAHFFMHHNFKYLQGKKIVIQDTQSKKQKEFSQDYIIGADGAQSLVAKSAGLLSHRTWKLAIKAVIKKKHNNAVQFYPFIEEIAWSSPHDSDHIEVGVVAPVDKANAIFETFVKRFGFGTIQKEAALVPLFDSAPKRQKENIFLIGDAAGQVKATTYGGIMQGLKAANACSKAINENGSYEREWRKAIGLDLYLHLQMRKALNKFTDSDWNRLVGYFQNERLIHVLESFSRDYPSKFIASLLMHEPRLFTFCTKAL